MDTGIKNVIYNESAFLKWEYHLEDDRKITGRSLKDLKSKITILGYEWKITDKDLADKSSKIDKPESVKFDEIIIHEKNIIPKKIKNNPPLQKNNSHRRILRTRIVSAPKTDFVYNTGFKNVKFDKLGNVWIYDDGNKKISHKYLWKLEDTVLNQNLEWIITDKKVSQEFKHKECELILSFSLPRFYKFLKDNYESILKSHKLNLIIEKYEIQNKGTGILFVTPIINETGNNWRYKNFEDDSWIYSSSLSDLEETIKDNNLIWKIIDNQLYKKSLKIDKELTKKLIQEIDIQKKITQTGLFRVSLNNEWEYNYSKGSENNFTIKRRSIPLLKKEVLNLNLPWIILNQDLFNKTEMKDKELAIKYDERKKLMEKQEKLERIEKLDK